MVVASHYVTETIFDYSWKQVVQAYWNRYPNPSSTHVLTEDTIKREVRDGKLYSRRILSKTNSVPKWGERFYKNTPIKILEDSVLDPNKKTLITFTRNIGFKKIMKVDEIVEYSEQKDGRTLAIRRAYISSQVFGFSRAIRAFGIERFKSNCNKAAMGFNYVLRNMFPSPLNTNYDNTSVPMNSFKSPAVHQFNQATAEAHSTTTKQEVLIKASKINYEYCKSQFLKVVQFLSVKS